MIVTYTMLLPAERQSPLNEFGPATHRPLKRNVVKPNNAADVPEATQSQHHWENCWAAEKTLADCSTVVIM